MPTSYLFGVGERRSKDFLLTEGTYTIYSKDNLFMLSTGQQA